jgi:hypothetical protein
MINRLVRKQISCKRPVQSFGHVAQSQQSFNNFQQIVNTKRQNMDSMFEDFKERMSRPHDVDKAYSHPLDHPHNRINFDPNEIHELFYDFMGPEQVSPHYENFAMSRKYAIGIWSGLFGLSMLAATKDFTWIIQGTIMPFAFLSFMTYYFYEARKTMFMLVNKPTPE